MPLSARLILPLASALAAVTLAVAPATPARAAPPGIECTQQVRTVSTWVPLTAPS